MKTILQPALAILMLSAGAWAQTTVDKICDAAPDVQVRIKNVAGSVSVRAWDRDQVQVQGTLGEDVERFDFTCKGSLVSMEVIFPKRKTRKIASYLTVSVPRQGSLNIHTVSADVEVNDVLGKIEAETVSGALTVKGAIGSVEMETVSGNITLEANSPEVSIETSSGQAIVSGKIAALDIESVSGRIDLSGTFGRLEADSMSGRITARGAVSEARTQTVSGDILLDRVLQAVEADTTSGSTQIVGERPVNLSITSISGKIEYSGGLAENGVLDVSSVSGLVSLQIPGDTSARFHVETNSGDISNTWGGPPPRRVAKYGPGRIWAHDGGTASGKVEVETISGDIYIKAN